MNGFHENITMDGVSMSHNRKYIICIVAFIIINITALGLIAVVEEPWLPAIVLGPLIVLALVIQNPFFWPFVLVIYGGIFFLPLRFYFSNPEKKYLAVLQGIIIAAHFLSAWVVFLFIVAGAA